MATEKIALGINLRQNKNVKMTESYGKYYPEVDHQKTLSLRGFAQHMADHGSFFSRSVVEGVLNQICECLPELLAQGVPVKLGSLGTFYPTAQVKKNAAVPDIASMEGLNPNDIVQGIRIRFQPDASKLDNLSSVAFKGSCSLELRNIVDTQEVTIDGKTQKLQTLKPIATAVAELKAQNGGSTNQGGSTGSNTGNTGNTQPTTPGGSDPDNGDGME